MKTDGFDRLVYKLQRRIDRTKLDSAARATVGFSAPYATPVHENLEAHHAVGQAKFLEEPARTNKATYARIISTEMKRGRSLGQAIFAAATQLKVDAQEMCPVDKGELRDSAFVKMTGASTEAR